MRGNPLFLQKVGFPHTPSGKNSKWLAVHQEGRFTPRHQHRIRLAASNMKVLTGRFGPTGGSANRRR